MGAGAAAVCGISLGLADGLGREEKLSQRRGRHLRLHRYHELYAVCRDVVSFREIEEIEEIEENLILPTFRKLSRFVDCNKPFFKRLMYWAFQNAEKQCAKWHDYEMHVAPYDKDKPIYYEFTACPAAEFAIKYGLTDIMPALCNVDLASMELLHARLVRKTTCVDGCRCDYTICGDKDPYLNDHPEYRDAAGYRRNR